MNRWVINICLALAGLVGWVGRGIGQPAQPQSVAPHPAAPSHADYQFVRYNTEKGLSHNQVNCFLKDSRGFVWIGTANGLNRFDGYSFRVFKHDPADSTSISDHQVNALFEDPQGYIWINTRLGFDIYDPVTETIDHNANQAAQRFGLSDADFNRIIKTRSGDYWISHNKLGLLKYRTASKQLIKVRFGPTQDAPGTRTISDFDEDAQGNLWVVCDDGLLARVNARTQGIDIRSVLLQRRNLGKLSNHKVFVDGQGEPWVYIVKAAVGAFNFDCTKNTLRVAGTSGPDFRLSNNAVSAMISGPDGRIWIGTDHGGINILDKQSGRVSTLRSNPGDPRTLSQNSIQALYKDATGMIWAGTYKQGFCNYHQNIFKFSLVRHLPGDATSLPFDDVNVFAEDRKGNLWVGTNGGGLIYYDRRNNSFRQFRNKPGDANSLSNDVIVSLFLDRQDVLWIGTYFGGLNSFDGRKFTRYLHDPADSTSLIDDRVWEIFEDSRRRLWVGTMADGLDLFDRSAKTFRHYRNRAPNSVNSDYISSMLEDRQGNLWVGTANGIDVLMRRTGRFVHYSYRAGDRNSLSSDAVMSLAQDNAGTIWIGTSEGLNRYDAARNAFVTYDTRHGLPDNSILTVIVDARQNLWLGTPKGMVNLQVTRRKATSAASTAFQVRAYNEVDGLQGRGFNENAALRLNSGELVFGGANGFSIFDPARVTDERTAAKVVLTDFQIFNKSIHPGLLADGSQVLEKSISTTDRIVLEHSQNVFTIEFAALNFLHPEKNHYQYRLEGFNDQWFEADNTRRVTYTNLDPGTYTFKIKTKEGGESTERRLEIRILPPFWQTPWAYLLYFLLIAAALMIARWILIERERMNFKLEQERHYAQQMHELDLMKIRFFTNVSHEFRTPLTLMLTPLENLLRGIRSDHTVHRQLSLVHRNAQRLLNLVTQMLDFKKLEVEETRFMPERGDIVQFVRQIAQTFSELSEHKHIRYRFESAVESRYADFDQDKLSKVMYNLLSNAFKFTPENGEVTVRLRTVGQEGGEALEISVEDSGIGIPPEAQQKVFERFYQHPTPGHMINQGSGIGLSIAGEFIKMHGGTIDLESEVGKGSTFTVTVPLRERLARVVPVQEADAMPVDAAPIDVDLYDEKAGKEKPLILLVEDNDEFREYLKEVFQKEYRVLEAANGRAGLDMTLEHIPDLIVSDVMMPEMDGTELCRTIKTDRRVSHIPVVLLTARAEEEQQLQGYQTGADAYVTKPFRLDILRVRIANLILQREQLQKQFQQHVEIRPTDVAVRSMDEQFVNSAVKVVEENLANAEYTVEQLSDAMSMSRVYLYKKVLSLTGKTPIEFIRIIRIRRAATLLEKSQLTVSEIAYQVGFNNPKYFAKLFKDEYQVLPTEYRRRQASQQILE